MATVSRTIVQGREPATLATFNLRPVVIRCACWAFSRLAYNPTRPSGREDRCGCPFRSTAGVCIRTSAIGTGGGPSSILHVCEICRNRSTHSAFRKATGSSCDLTSRRPSTTVITAPPPPSKRRGTRLGNTSAPFGPPIRLPRYTAGVYVHQQIKVSVSI